MIQAELAMEWLLQQEGMADGDDSAMADESFAPDTDVRAPTPCSAPAAGCHCRAKAGEQRGRGCSPAF